MRGIGWLVAFVLAAVFAAVLAASAAQAQPYPNKPIRAIVPFPAGSATDGMARLVSAHFTKVADFTPLALLSRAPHAMVVRADAPYPAFRDFIAAAKGKPDTLNFGFGNTGSLAGGAMLNSYAGIKTAAVSYRGTPQATTDLLGGQIQFVVMDVSQTQEHIKAGKLRTLAVTGQTRMEIFPETPTMIELGFPDFVLYSWNGVHGPPGMPAEIVATLNSAIRDAIKTPEGRRFYDALGAEIGTMSAKEFGDFVAQELKRWEKIIALTGLPKQ